LGGLKIAVTRPKDRSSKLAQKLTDNGAEVVLLPAIRTKRIENNQQLKRALSSIKDYSWVGFTSVAGVQGFFDALTEAKMDIRSLAGLKFAAIGSATKKEIEEKGIFVDLVPEEYSGEAMGRALAKVLDVRDRILIPRAKIGTEEVLEPLKKAGILFDDIAVYETEEGTEKIFAPYDESVDYVAFTSASTVRGFVKLNPDAALEKIKALCIGEQTGREAKKHGMKAMIAKEATIDSMVDLLLESAKS
jgi:uroporphyrinogen III methyltransferase/synthase